MLQPFQLGGLTLPSRLVMTTVKLGYGAEIGDAYQPRKALDAI